MVVVYSFDMNVLRATPNGKPICIPFTMGGRKLSPKQLEKVARKAWGRVSEFRYLKEGEGF
jgi:hypothetical protein